MSTLAQGANWLGCCPCCGQAWTKSQPRPTDLAQRYALGDSHERLCLWLQHREARAQLDLIESTTPARPASLRRRLHRLMGIPFVG